MQEQVGLLLQDSVDCPESQVPSGHHLRTQQSGVFFLLARGSKLNSYVAFPSTEGVGRELLSTPEYGYKSRYLLGIFKYGFPVRFCMPYSSHLVFSKARVVWPFLCGYFF